MIIKAKTRSIEIQFAIPQPVAVIEVAGNRNFYLEELDDATIHQMANEWRNKFYALAKRETPPEAVRSIQILPEDVEAFLKELDDSSIPDLIRSRAKSLLKLHELPF
jgi:hypothetical protein